MKAAVKNRRLQKEAENLQKSEDFKLKINDENFKEWYISLTMPSETIYAGEEYTLRFNFSDNYVIW